VGLGRRRRERHVGKNEIDFGSPDGYPVPVILRRGREWALEDGEGSDMWEKTKLISVGRMDTVPVNYLFGYKLLNSHILRV